MDYTLSNAYTTDAGTGNRMHQQSAATTTAVTDQDMNGVIWELLAIIKAGGLAPVAFDKTVPATYTQVAAAIQSGKLFSAAAAGTADAITATFTPGITALKDGMALYVRGAAANATTTPTFTPASGTIAAKAIVKGAGAVLAAGDIAGAGHWVELQYDLTLDKWVLLNPATGISSQQVKQIQPITASVAANALTITLNPTTLDFRSPTLSSGSVNTRSVPSAISITVPAGATLGTVSGQAARLLVYAIDNAGTVVLGVANAQTTYSFESDYPTTTAMSVGATSPSLIYTQSAVSGPLRIVGFIDITEAAAGTWASAPTVVQGFGGTALNAIGTIGYGQAWQNVLGSRTSGTTYYNTTGRPILVSIAPSASATTTNLTINGITIFNGTYGGAVGIVPPGGSYVGTNASEIAYWAELR